MIVTDRDADQVLADIFANSGNGDAAIRVKGISVPPTATDGARYVVHALPLTSGTRGYAGSNYSAVAALFEAPSGAPSLPEAIAAAFKLTELRVLLAIVEVGGVPEVAKVLGIRLESVKTHLRRVFQRTGASRHLDLAKIVARFSNPLLS
jgi:DNA-binding CsgD family transcriptional regulator